MGVLFQLNFNSHHVHKLVDYLNRLTKSPKGQDGAARQRVKGLACLSDRGNLDLLRPFIAILNPRPTQAS
ncbi:MAG: hypothetical protein ACI82H_000268 [Alphaproteobacteria bacterium]|jgi:hypothetical protein